jgi:hypothetical protein
MMLNQSQGELFDDRALHLRSRALPAGREAAKVEPAPTLSLVEDL